MEKTLKELAELVGGSVKGDGSVAITGIAGIREAGPHDLTFIDNPKYSSFARTTDAAAIIVAKEQELDKPLLVVKNVRMAYGAVAGLFQREPDFPTGVSDKAVVEESARLGEGVAIHPLAYIGADAEIGARARIMSGAVIEEGAIIGEDCLIHPNVTVKYGCVLGNRVIVHSGTVIGSDGFAYAQDGARHVKIPQIGTVLIEDDVEIGANCAIDRASLGKTWIKRGAKIDNLVQIAHNVVVGENTMIIAMVGISGSSEIGANVILAGQVGVAGHIKIGDRVMVGAQSGLHKNIGDGEIISGSPAIPHRQWLRVAQYSAKLPEMHKRLVALEKMVSELEEKLSGD